MVAEPASVPQHRVQRGERHPGPRTGKIRTRCVYRESRWLWNVTVGPYVWRKFGSLFCSVSRLFSGEFWSHSARLNESGSVCRSTICLWLPELLKRCQPLSRFDSNISINVKRLLSSCLSGLALSDNECKVNLSPLTALVANLSHKSASRSSATRT